MTERTALEQKLRNIKNDDQFVMGVLSFAGRENFHLVLSYIDTHDNCEEQDVAWLAFELHEMREIPVGTEEYKRRIAELTQ